MKRTDRKKENLQWSQLIERRRHHIVLGGGIYRDKYHAKPHDGKWAEKPEIVNRYVIQILLQTLFLIFDKYNLYLDLFKGTYCAKYHSCVRVCVGGGGGQEQDCRKNALKLLLLG